MANIDFKGMVEEIKSGKYTLLLDINTRSRTEMIAVGHCKWVKVYVVAISGCNEELG